jgi:hypothetical protein
MEELEIAIVNAPDGVAIIFRNRRLSAKLITPIQRLAGSQPARRGRP